MSCNFVTAPQNSPANSTKERFRRLRARTQAANSIAVKEDELFGSSLLSHGVTQGSQERGDEELL